MFLFGFLLKFSFLKEPAWPLWIDCGKKHKLCEFAKIKIFDFIGYINVYKLLVVSSKKITKLNFSLVIFYLF